MAESQANDNNTCVVCFKTVEYYSIGECDHPVCFECSTRMRVLCLQNECPICRQDLSRVVFTENVRPYKELNSTRPCTDKKIVFSSDKIKNAYEELLQNRCKLCDKTSSFRTFNLLSDHMRKVHERYFCDLCVKHLRIFTFERKCYTRQELAHHRRKGDLDDTSHRGHPLCEFCEERFMDADELYRHLRKAHLYCHLCDADGRNLYYASHSALAHHFRTDHYLCEEGDCAGNHLTAVFRSEIDLKAHKATEHGRGMTRGAARQARTLELQFNITPHPVVRERAPNVRERQEAVSPPPSPAPAPAPRIDTHSDAHFPRLSAAPAPHLLNSAPLRNYQGSEGLARTDKNFPTLGGGPAPGPSRAPTPTRPQAAVAATVLRNSKPSVSIQLHSQPASASNFRLTQTSGNRISIPPQRKQQPLDDDDFPSLGVSKDDHPSIGAATVQPPKVAMINSEEMQALKGNQGHSQSKKAPLSSEAFPALSSAAAPSTPPKWIKVPKPKEKAKLVKPEPPPKQPAFNATADFPNLPANQAKPKPKKSPQSRSPPTPSHAPAPAPAPTPTVTPDTKLSKREKKKQNNINKEVVMADMSLDSYVNGINDKFSKSQMKEAYNAAVNVNNNQTSEMDKKIKTIETASIEKRSGGNGDFNLAAVDYPPLNPKSKNAKNASSNKKTANGRVPPGFQARPACGGMTFTNSSGQTFAAPVHAYIPPPDFEQRNRTLVKRFVDALGSAAAVDDFKAASRAFRDSVITAADFYEHCNSAMGSHLESVFADLVALLPDIGKQQELVVGRDIEGKLEVCGTCGQLMPPHDREPHNAAHWPPLAPH